MDILGFSRDVLLVESRPGLFLTHEGVLTAIANCTSDVQRSRVAGSVRHDTRMVHASDSVFMSFADEPGASLKAIASAAFVAQSIVRRGYLVRGAITIGPMSHTDFVLWGRAVIEAVQMERDDVRTPRIALREDVARRVREELRRPLRPMENFIRDRGDGPFVHILGPAWPFLDEIRRKKEAGEYGTDGIDEMYEEMRNSLRVRYDNAPDERARDKLRWFAAYVNDTIVEQNLNSAWRVVLPERERTWSCCLPWRKKKAPQA